jgi:hypothetical protein
MPTYSCDGRRSAGASGGVLMPKSDWVELLMAGSFGILFVILVVGAANLALGYAAAVYFGKARLELVWVTFTLPNPLAWLRREERTETFAPATVTFAPAAGPETAYAAVAPAANDYTYAPVAAPEPMPDWQPAAEASAADAGLEASLSAYSAAVRNALPGNGAEDFGPVESAPAREEAAPYDPAPAAPTAEAGLDALLDDLVAQNLSELQGAFARIDQAQPAAKPTSPAESPVREAITIPQSA